MHGHANICHVMCDYCMGVVLEEKGGGVFSFFLVGIIKFMT